MSRLAHWSSNPAYYIEDCRIFILTCGAPEQHSKDKKEQKYLRLCLFPKLQVELTFFNLGRLYLFTSISRLDAHKRNLLKYYITKIQITQDLIFNTTLLCEVTINFIGKCFFFHPHLRIKSKASAYMSRHLYIKSKTSAYSIGTCFRFYM